MAYIMTPHRKLRVSTSFMGSAPPFFASTGTRVAFFATALLRLALSARALDRSYNSCRSEDMYALNGTYNYCGFSFPDSNDYKRVVKSFDSINTAHVGLLSISIILSGIDWLPYLWISRWVTFYWFSRQYHSAFWGKGFLEKRKILALARISALAGLTALQLVISFICEALAVNLMNEWQKASSAIEHLNKIHARYPRKGDLNPDKNAMARLLGPSVALTVFSTMDLIIRWLVLWVRRVHPMSWKGPLFIEPHTAQRPAGDHINEIETETGDTTGILAGIYKRQQQQQQQQQHRHPQQHEVISVHDTELQTTPATSEPAEIVESNQQLAQVVQITTSTDLRRNSYTRLPPMELSKEVLFWNLPDNRPRYTRFMVFIWAWMLLALPQNILVAGFQLSHLREDNLTCTR